MVLALGATGCDKQVSFVGSTRGSSFVELTPEQPVAVVRATIEVGDGGLPPRSRYAGSSLDVDVQLQHYVGCEDCTTEVDVTYVDQDLDQRVELRPGSSVSASSLKVIPRKIPKPLMATTSSAAQAEITRVGIPLATP